MNLVLHNKAAGEIRAGNTLIQASQTITVGKKKLDEKQAVGKANI